MPDLARDVDTLHYDRAGSGPPVILLQGVGHAGRSWRPQVEALAARFTVLTVDNRGVGRSSLADPRALTIEMLADDALAVLDAEGVDRAHVAGHSMGGAMAVALALQAPSRVRSLALLCTFHRGRDATAVTPTMLWLGIRSSIGTAAMRRRAFVQMILPSSYLGTRDRREVEAELTKLFGFDLAARRPIVMTQLRALARFDATDRLGLIGAPTLVISGAEDLIARPASGRALASAVPGARFVEVPGAGHAATIQKADVLNALLVEHLLASEGG